MHNKKRIVFLSIITIALVVICVVLFNTINRDVPNDDSKVDKIKLIDEYVSEVKLNTNIISLEDEVGADILGKDSQSYIDILQVDGVSVNVKKCKDTFIKIIPMPDMNIDTYYYKDNKLVLYEIESTTIGGRYLYYFDNDQIIKTVRDGEMLNDDTATEILTKFNNVYNKYN